MPTTTQQELLTALEALGFEALQGKGGFWLRGKGHITTAQARRLTSLKAQPRIYRERIAYGDYAQLIGFLNRKGN